MANKLKVDELRAKLAERGLSTAGTKAVLVERLEEAISETSKKKEVSQSKKRKRDCADGNEESNMVKAVDELRQMSVKQLREEANRRGLASTGTKKELLDRLCDDADKQLNSPDKAVDVGAKVGDKEKDVKGESKEEKIVTAMKKGAAVLDQWLPDDIKNNYHVLQLGDDVYDAMLNQTNLKDNNNKFFVIQVLESDSNKTYMVYTRWGRVGVKGQSKLDGPYGSSDRAIAIFSSKFFDKTKNCWSDRKEFVPHPKCYKWLEMDYNKEEKDSANDLPKSSLEVKPQETRLEPRLAKLISLICNVSMMVQQMMEIGYNANRLPLGKLSKSTISKGYEVLKRISEVIDRQERATLEELSGEFYTVIPHDFGFRKMREFVIDTPQKLKQKLEMVEALGEIEVATKLLSENSDLQDPLYSHYQRLNCDLTPVGTDTEEFSMIAKYMENTHAKTHSGYTVDIVQVFRASRAGEADRFKKFSRSKNRMLLWHGSRLTNWTGILSQGLRIAPPEAPVTGYMFGKGVYFADMFSKSANYCFASCTANDGVLLLCEVALGDMAELLYANYNADKLPPGKLSTKGVGRTAPKPSQAQILDDGVIVPLGNPVDQPSPKGTLLYNEYIVYNVEQIRMRYVIQVKFKYEY